MTPVPTMNTAASEIPSELMPSIGTGCASTNVAASRSARTPPRTAALGPDAANQNIATPSSAKPTRAVGRRIGRRRAVSRETKRARLTSPAALSMERTGCTFTVMPYYFAVLPGPPFQVAQKSGQKSSDDGKVRELYLPMQHLGSSPVWTPRTTAVSVDASTANIPLPGDSAIPRGKRGCATKGRLREAGAVPRRSDPHTSRRRERVSHPARTSGSSSRCPDKCPCGRPAKAAS